MCVCVCVFRYYCLSILDKHHHPDIDLEQGMKLLGMCCDELKRRLPIDFKGVSALAFTASIFTRSFIRQGFPIVEVRLADLIFCPVADVGQGCR